LQDEFRVVATSFAGRRGGPSGTRIADLPSKGELAMGKTIGDAAKWADVRPTLVQRSQVEPAASKPHAPPFRDIFATLSRTALRNAADRTRTCIESASVEMCGIVSAFCSPNVAR
jgi:hypothetical protein